LIPALSTVIDVARVIGIFAGAIVGIAGVVKLVRRKPPPTPLVTISQGPRHGSMRGIELQPFVVSGSTTGLAVSVTLEAVGHVFGPDGPPQTVPPHGRADFSVWVPDAILSELGRQGAMDGRNYTMRAFVSNEAGDRWEVTAHGPDLPTTRYVRQPRFARLRRLRLPWQPRVAEQADT
jgi:hypothetical protein